MAIYVLIGQNLSLIERKINELSSNFDLLSYNNNFQEFFFELQKITNQFLWSKKKDIVLKNLDKLKNNEISVLISFLNNSQNNFILIFPQEPTDFLDRLRKNKIKFKIFNLQPPTKRNLEEFIKNYALERKIRLSPEIIKFLKENYQENFDLLLSDLEKISILTKNPTIDDFKQILHFQTNVFKIQDYFLDRNWPLFVHHFKKFILEDKSNGKAETLKTLSLLFNSLLKIYLIKTGKINKIKANDYYLQRLKEKARNLSIEEIKLLISALAKTDRKFKKFYISPIDLPEDISLNYLMQLSPSFPQFKT
jgi:DNA polymerase III delta subunit